MQAFFLYRVSKSFHRGSFRDEPHITFIKTTLNYCFYFMDMLYSLTRNKKTKQG